MKELTYEQTLDALQALLNTHVSVSVAQADGSFTPALLYGSLYSAEELDIESLVREELGAPLDDRARRKTGEQLVFLVREEGGVSTAGMFAVQRSGFRWGAIRDGHIFVCIGSTLLRIHALTSVPSR